MISDYDVFQEFVLVTLVYMGWQDMVTIKHDFHFFKTTMEPKIMKNAWKTTVYWSSALQKYIGEKLQNGAKENLSLKISLCVPSVNNG